MSLPQVNEVWGVPKKPDTWRLIERIGGAGAVSWTAFHRAAGFSEPHEFTAWQREVNSVRISTPSASDLREAAKLLRYDADTYRIDGNPSLCDKYEKLAARLESHLPKEQP